MALTPSSMLALGTQAPAFDLPTAGGGQVSLHSFAHNPVLLVAFICNHCPYVQHIRPALAQLGRDMQKQGLAMVAINSNDTQAYPADDMDHMRLEVAAAGYSFPYALDETQAIARAYDAACTPDFFLFDQHRTLVYRGQLDNSRPGNGIAVTGEDLRAAIAKVAAGKPVNTLQKPSVGCGIKWRTPAPN